MEVALDQVSAAYTFKNVVFLSRRRLSLVGGSLEEEIGSGFVLNKEQL